MVVRLLNKKSSKYINSKLKNHSDKDTNHEEGKTIIISKDEYKRIGVAVTIILVIIAISFVFLSYLQNNTQLQNCKGIVYQAQRDSCIQSLAIKNNNVSICQNLPQTNEYACIDNISLKANNVSECTIINQSKVSSDCITNIAMKNKEVNYCTKIANDIFESNCIYNISKLGYINDISYCNKINNQIQQNNCKYIYYYDTALSTRNKSYCDNIPNTNTNSTLNQYVLMNSYPNSNISFIFTAYVSNLSDRQICYLGSSRLSNSSKSSNSCTSLNGTAKKACLNQSTPIGSNNKFIINSTNLSSLCSVANKSKNYFLCEFSSLLINASKSDNYSVCLSSSNQNYANICLINLATEYNNTADCNYIQNLTVRSVCISNVTK